MPAHQRFEIGAPSEVSYAHRSIRAIAALHGLSEARIDDVSIIVAELGANLLRYATRGELLVCLLTDSARLHPGGVGRAGIEILSIAKSFDTAGATSSSMIADWAVGISERGMAAIRRLSDEFDVWSAPGAGAVLRVVLWSDAPPHGPAAAAAMTGGVPVEYGAINLALRGQVVSGDACACTQGVEGFTVMIADGLGHGLLAHSAAVAAIGSLSPGSGAPLPEIISVADRALRPTVGAALGVARLPPRAVLPDPGDPGADSDQRGTAFSRADSVARFCGIGNVAASVWSAAAHRHLVSHAGIVGRGIRKTQEFDGAWSPGALFVMHSDGLNTRWDLARYPGLSVSHPSLIAAVLYRDHSREDDDLTVLVARDRRTPA